MNVLNIGSLNIDLVYRVPHIVQPGETIAARSFARFAGGKGLNQSIALARAGAAVCHAGAIGNDGLFLRKMLESEGVDCSGIAVLEQIPTGSALIQVADDGENSIVVCGGANQELELPMVEAALGRMAPGDAVLLQNEISALPDIFQAAAARRLRLFFNPSPMVNALAELPLELADTLLVNEGEGALLNRLAPEKLAQCNVLTTLGSRGACYRSRSGETFAVPAAKASKIVDTTGAGDTFTGYFVAGLARGLAVDAAMTEAAAAAAIAVSRPGAAASIPYARELVK